MKKSKKILKLMVLLFAMVIVYFQNDIRLFVDNLYESANGNLYINYDIPDYSGNMSIAINNNEPMFDEKLKNTRSFESYSRLDNLNRCGVAIANIGKELMPTEKRGSIGMIKPSGWHTIKYDIIKDKYLYNRCHLIGYQLTGENANEKNLITCTRQMNTIGMLEYENMVANYIKETNNHVLYKATPIFEDNNLIAKGIVLEALSLEDDGEGIKFNVFIYNVQDGIEIDYLTGESRLSVE